MNHIQTKSMMGISLKKFIPGVAWFFIVLILICLPKDDIPEISGWWAWLNYIYFDKWIHVGIFGILAFMFMMPFGRADLHTKTKLRSFILVASLVSLWGLSTEFIQLFVPGRSFDLKDWAADSLGALLSILLSRKIYLRRIKEI